MHSIHSHGNVSRKVILLALALLVGVGAAPIHAISQKKCEKRIMNAGHDRDRRVKRCNRRFAAHPKFNVEECIAGAAEAYEKAMQRIACVQHPPDPGPTDPGPGDPGPGNPGPGNPGPGNPDPGNPGPGNPGPGNPGPGNPGPGNPGPGNPGPGNPGPGNPPVQPTACVPIRVGRGVERCVERKTDGSVYLYMNRMDATPWKGTYTQANEPDINHCGPTAGKNFLSWYGMDALYEDLASEMKTNSWDNGPVLGAAGLICAFEPICTAILTSTISDLVVKAGSLPRHVRDSLYGRMPAGYQACGSEGVDSLEDIRASLASGNPVVFLESGGRNNLHWAVITGLETRGADTFVHVANSSGGSWTEFHTDWSLSRIGGGGTAGGSCASGFEKDGELCYPNCRPGYDGVGPICWEICPEGYTDDGVTCRHHDLHIIGRDNYGRGAGTVPSSCGAGEERNGALCYPACGEGYYGVGPVCWQSCPAGYHDDGVTCRRDGEIIGANNDNCPWYDKCGLTFAQGCSSCPDGYDNDGCTCRIDPHIFGKDTYGRGVGSTLSCAPDQQYDAGLCYTPCNAGYSGAGPVCWQNCPDGYTNDGATCRRDSGVTIIGKDSYGRGAGSASSDGMLRILGQQDLGVVPYVAIRWCGAPS